MKSNPGRVKSVLTDLQIVVERHSEVLVTNHALPFQILMGATTIGHVLSFSISLFSFFSLSANQLYSVELWRLFTAPFVGRNILELALTICTLQFGCSLVRQNNTNQQLLKSFALVQLCTSVVVCVIALLGYLLFGFTDLLYKQPIVGMMPVDMTIMVLIKQFLPDSIVFSTPLGRIKYTHLPLLLCTVSVICALLTLSHWVLPLQSFVAMQVAWTYFRFIQPHPTDAIYGDQSEHFTWASLFPAKSRPFMALIGTAVYRILVKLGLIQRTVRHVDINQLQSVNVAMLPSFEDPIRDAERRRNLALRALNERLARTKKVEIVEWPSDEEDTTVKTHDQPSQEKELEAVTSSEA